MSKIQIFSQRPPQPKPLKLVIQSIVELMRPTLLTHLTRHECMSNFAFIHTPIKKDLALDLLRSLFLPFLDKRTRDERHCDSFRRAKRLRSFSLLHYYVNQPQPILLASHLFYDNDEKSCCSGVSK